MGTTRRGPELHPAGEGLGWGVTCRMVIHSRVKMRTTKDARTKGRWGARGGERLVRRVRLLSHVT